MTAHNLTTYRQAHIYRPLIKAGFPEPFARAACNYGATLWDHAVIDGKHFALIRQTRKPVKGWNRPPVLNLVGMDDGQVFRHRIPSTVGTIDKALHWMIPGAVSRAKAKGWPVVRQGDVWAIGRPVERQNAVCINPDAVRWIRHSVVDVERPWLILRHEGGEHPDRVLFGGHDWRLILTPSVDGAGD